MNGVERFGAERQRQIDVEGYTPEHDARSYIPGQLADAAIAYILSARGYAEEGAVYHWPWNLRSFKPKHAPP